jgi:PAS domain S-box-containing protein
MSRVLATPALIESPRPTLMAEAFQNLQHAVAQCQDAIFISDSAGIIMRVNPAFERLTGYSALEIVGKDLSVFTDGGPESKLYQAIWRRIFEEKRYTGTLNLRTKSGKVVEMDLTLTPVYASRGHLVSLVGTGRAKSAPATRQLNQQSPVLDSRTERMFHDLNNVVMVIVAHADLAVDTIDLDHPARRHVENCRSAARSAAALLHEFRRGGPNWPLPPPPPTDLPSTIQPPRGDDVRQSHIGCESAPTILVVDDESRILSSIAGFFKAVGYNVLTAATGGDALDLVGDYKGPIDVLVTDIVLPQVSGSELAVSIAASHPEAKVLAISGHPEDFVLRQPGIGYYLPKPFCLPDLHKKVLSILREKKPARAVGTR